MDIDLSRYTELPPVTEADYEAAVAKALGTRTLDQLRAVTLDGLRVPAIGRRRDDCAAVPGRGAGTAWSIVQKVPLGEPAETNAVVLEHLQGGVDAIDLLLPAGAPIAGGTAADPDGLIDRVFAGVHLDMVSVHVTGASDPAGFARLLAGVAERSGRGAAGSRIRTGFDPVVAALWQGGDFASAHARTARAATGAIAAADLPPGTMPVAVRGEAWAALGATDLQQLAILLSAGADVVERSIAAGLSPDAAADLSERIEFRVAADHNQFLTMARLRAFRRLWALVLDAFGLPQRPAFVHAETAWRMTTRRDPWVNILRSTIATFAAAAGGADAITTVPHTALLGMPDAAARRLSRNVQTILADEVNLHRVGDPAAGAGGIEDLTDMLAEAGWSAFQVLEAEGGLAAAVASGALLARIAEADAKECALVAKRRISLIGTSTWPLLGEREAEVVPGPPLATPPMPGARRLAEPFEALRDRSDALLAGTGARPTLFLATLGPVASHGARATWAKALFEAGGIAVVGGDPYADAETAAAAFTASGAKGACLCADDATYAAHAATAAAALADAGAAPVILAGRPPADGGPYGPAVGGFVHEGQDMVETLGGLVDRIVSRETTR
jgi:methylmalonyl-CoA mutase